MIRTRSAGAIRRGARSKVYHPSFESLKLACREIFSDKIRVADCTRVIQDTGIGLFEKVIRLPASLPTSAVRSQVLQQLSIFFREHNATEVNVSMTANFVLKGNINGNNTYSLFYGQTFSKSNDGGQPHSMQYVVKDLAHANRVIPFDKSLGELMEHFDSIRTKVSGTTVVRVVSRVFILRALKSKKESKQQQQSSPPARQ